jgi:integrase
VVLRYKDAARFTRHDVEDVRDRLDREMRAGSISWKTAMHTWSDLKCMCGQMQNSKDRKLRTRTDDPTRGVLPPDKGPDKAKTILYPDELAALLSCEDVPFAYRVLYALAVYTGLRAGELEALTVGDVDLAHRFLHIDKAVSRETGELGPCKHDHIGDVPIEPALVPLLRALTEGRAASATLVWMPVDEDRAPALRRHLAAANVTRAAITLHDARNKRLWFHDLRATHLTGRACRGDAPALIQAVARHASFQTTLGYINRATLLGGLGPLVFAPLPETLAQGAGRFGQVLDAWRLAPLRGRNHPAFQRPQWELNPCYRRERPAS